MRYRAARAQNIRAFPMLGFYRNGSKLVDFTPSQRGDPVGRLTRNIELVATTNVAGADNSHFRMMSNEARLLPLSRETPPNNSE